MTAKYSIEGGLSGKQRLDVLARVCAPYTNALLDRVGVSDRASCLDVGCGGGHVSRELARRAAHGSVVGVDLDPTVLELAAADTAAADITNLEFRRGDATQLDAASYDIVYARFLLRHVAQPSEIVAVMAQALKPGGVLIVEDNDFNGYLWHPPSRALDRYVDIYRQTVRRGGGNPDIGPTLPSLLLKAGLQDVAVAAYQACGMQGEVKLITPLTLDRIATAAVENGVTTTDEVAHLLGELNLYAADTTTLLSLPRVVQAWATKTRTVG